jgi:hypothetical protein
VVRHDRGAGCGHVLHDHSTKLYHRGGTFLIKACSVNLNYTREICGNISDHQEVQIKTQELVSGIQVSYPVAQ